MTDPDLHIPSEPLTALLDQAAARFGDRTAIAYHGTRLTYAELRRQADAVAWALQQAGIGTGDRVLLLMPNMPPFVAAWYGILKAGAAVVPVGAQATDAEIETIAADAQPTAAISIRMFYPVLARTRSFAPLKVIMLAHIREYLKAFQSLLFSTLSDRMGALAAATGADPELLWFQDVVRAGGFPTGGPRPQDLAVLKYTSGTTGRPKGAMLTHANLVANAYQLRAWWTDARDGAESILGVLPLTQVFAMTGCMNLSILLGATLILLPTFDVSEVLSAIGSFHPSMFPGVPRMYVQLSEHPGIRRTALHGLRACISGAAPLAIEVKEAFERLTRGRLVEGYGLTEASPVTHSNPLERHKTGTIGLPLVGTRARIVDLDTREVVPIGEVGELEVSGPQVMQGYWNMPELTARTLRDGWLRTGDLASMDKDGYFQLVCRTQEQIQMGDGRVMYPRDVEEVLYEHPQVLDCAVVGLSRPGRDPLVKACIVPRRGQAVKADDVLSFCRTRVAAWKVPSEVEVRGSLPRNPEGKVLYRLLQTEMSRDATVMGDLLD